MAGVKFANANHSTWSVIPEAEIDLDYAVAGVSSATGDLLASGWSKTSQWSFELAVKAPAETRGQIGVPVLWRDDQHYEIHLNGRLVARGVGNNSLPLDSVEANSIPHRSGRHLILGGLDGGNYSISVSFRD